MTTARRKRIIAAAFCLVLVVITFPVWFPWVLKPVANRLGLHYASYERVGIARFTLQTVSYTNKNVHITAQRVQTFLPTTWLWRRFASGNTNTIVSVNDWTLIIKQKEGKASSSPYTNFHKTRIAMERVYQWVPGAELTNGIVTVRSKRVAVPTATWNQGRLAGEWKYSTNLHGAFGGDVSGTPMTINIELPHYKVKAGTELKETTGGFAIALNSEWLTNQFLAAAEFDRSNALPQTASFKVEQFHIPTNTVLLPNHGVITGSFFSRWHSNQFIADLSAVAPPLDASTNILLNIHGAGDLQHLTVTKFNLQAPWLNARLTRDLILPWGNLWPTNPVALIVSGDLEEQPWMDLTGRYTGHARLTPSLYDYPTISFSLEASDLGSAEFASGRVLLDGTLTYPWVHLEKVEVRLPDDSIASLSGRLNLREHRVEDGALRLETTKDPKWLAPEYSYEAVSLSAKFHGPVKRLFHDGTLKLTGLKRPKLPTTRIDLAWSGEHTAFESVEGEIAAGNSSLTLEGAGDIATTNLLVRKFSFVSNNIPVLTLEYPFLVTANAHSNQWKLEVESFRVLGSNQQIAVGGKLTWPHEGIFSATMTNIDVAQFKDFVALPRTGIRIHHLQLSNYWDRGPLQFVASGLASSQQDIQAAAAFDADATPEGISFKKISILASNDVVFTAQGFLPISIDPSKPGLVQFISNQPVRLTATSRPNSIVWEKIASWTGLVFSEPHLDLDVSGKWDALRGKVVATAKQLKIEDRKLPVLENLDLLLELDTKTARLKKFNVLANKQPVYLNGEVPLGKKYWDSLGKRRIVPNLDEARAHLEMEHAPIEAFAEFLPSAIAPQGSVDVDITLAPGRELSGGFSIRSATTAPIGTLGPIREINVSANFEGEQLRIKSATGLVAGETAHVTGFVQNPLSILTNRALPRFEFRLSGTNISLVRQADVILRADLNLTNSNSGNGVPIISGSVNLRDSFFLSNLRDLAPGRVARPEMRPPYFSVTAEPFSAWQLNVAVRGTNSMRVRTPIFNGVLSASLGLSGTLRDPLAVGQVTVNSGMAQFPFASLRTEQGFVTLTSDNPYQPRLFVTASTKRLGYDVRMEITGTADEPIVEFSSIPALSSEQILLMLTAGQFPNNEISLTTQQKAQRVGLFVGKSFLSQFGFGGDEERLTIRSGEDVTESGSQTYDVEYRISDNWSIVGQYDRFNDFNVGLKWRIYSR